jgi:hypothetical protein
MPNRVRIEGDPDIWEVIAETPFLKLLANRAARHRQTIAHLEGELAQASRRLNEAVANETSTEDRS